MPAPERKSLSSTFRSPGTLVPVTFGAAAILTALTLGSGFGIGVYVGIASILTGFTVMAARLLPQSAPQIQYTEPAAAETESRTRRDELKLLEASLVLDGDVRTETSLRRLCEHYDNFQEKVEEGALSAAGYEVTHRVEQLFQASIDQLRRSHELWEEAHTFDDAEMQAILDEREEIVREVVTTTDHVNRAVSEFRRIQDRREDHDLGQLREELDESLRVAKAVEERMAAWENPTREHSPSEFE